MTRKDYILIAAALRDTLLIDCPTYQYLAGAKAAHVSAAYRLADCLARDNPRFDRERFLKAAGVQS
jgi:hypothetical protein